MKGLKALLSKDLRLFRGGTGLVCLLLPLLLLLALGVGAGDMVRRAYVEPFAIALRDEDNTVMSRSLTSQMEQVELFSQVIRAGDESDEELLARGCAAVITLPKDFFYAMYRMDNALVRVVLNEDMPLESALFRSLFGSVMEIIAADQSAARAVFRFCYGDLSPQRQEELWQETSQRLVGDALGRQGVFDSKLETADFQDSLERGFLACALSVLCLFFPMAAVKTLPEELNSGVLPRFLAAGGRIEAFFLSKFLAAALLAAPSLGLLLMAFRPEGWPQILLLAGILFFGAFGLLLWAAAWAGEVTAAQRWGNLILLLSLMLGGAIYAPELLPGPAQLLGRFTLPYYARRGLELIHADSGVGALLGGVWPALLLGVVFTALAVPALARRSRRGGTAAQPDGEAAPPPVSAHRRSLRGRLGPTTGWKLWAMSGGKAGLMALLLVCLLCGTLAAGALGRQSPGRLEVAVSVEEPGPLAQELLDRMEAMDGVHLQLVSAREGQRLLGRGRVEGLLRIGADYDRALTAGEKLPLHYESAGAAASAQGVREMVAGQVSAQQARMRGLRDAAARLDRPLRETETAQLLAAMDEDARLAPPLYAFAALDGEHAPAADPFAPEVLGFAALVVMLTVFTWAAWTGRTDARQVERRMASVADGRTLSYGSDALALILVGLAAGLVCLLPGGVAGLWTLPALAAYVCCVAGLALALTRRTALSGRMDALAPFLALITCLVGGCFGDVGQVSPGLRTLSLLTPQGLALRAGAGHGGALIILILAGAALLWLGAPPKETAKSV